MVKDPCFARSHATQVDFTDITDTLGSQNLSDAGPM